MTTKEIAEAVGKTERSVRNWVAKVAENFSAVAEKSSASTSTNPADYNLEETCLIIETGMGKNAADLYRMSAKQHTATITPMLGSTLTQKDLEMVGVIVASVMKNLDGRVSFLENKYEQKKALLPAPAKDDRAALNEIIRSVSAKKSMAYANVWGMLYKEYSYRTHRNVRQCAKNEAMAILDWIEKEGLLSELLSVAIEFLNEVTA